MIQVEEVRKYNIPGATNCCNRHDWFRHRGIDRATVRDHRRRAGVTEDSSVPDVGELLSLLGNETRMGIVRTLWGEFEFETYVTEARDGTPYSDLLDAADTDDSGNFNYHLRQLDGVLVADRGDGYVLTPLGYNLMRSITRYDDFEYATLDERPVGDPCPFCDGTLVVEYSREVLSVRCRDCGGLASGGNFTFVEVPATGAGSLDVPALLDAATLAMFEKVRSASRGICWDCRGTMDRSVGVCEGHDPGPDGTCEACDLRFATDVAATCGNCGNRGQGPALEYAVAAPGVAAFFDRFDLGPGTAGPWRYRLAAMGAASESVRETDPVSVDVTFEREGAACTATVADRDDGVVIDVRSD